MTKKKVVTNKQEKESWVAQKLYARERTMLAYERNSLAYVRTGFSAFVLGLAFIKLFEQDQFFVNSGIISLVLGVAFILLGIILYFVRNNKLKSE